MLLISTATPLFGAPLYDEEELLHWQTRYARSTSDILTSVLAPALRDTERQTLQNLRIAFPINRENFLAFHKQLTPPSITLPITSLKFLDDLCITSEWLSQKGRSQQWLEYYLAMLHYKDANDFVGGRYPTPLEAFNITETEANDPEVDRQALRCFNTIRAFILAKNLGGLYYADHKANDRENATDAFGIAVLARIPALPSGLPIYFLAQAILSSKAWEGTLRPAAITARHEPFNANRINDIIGAIDARRSQFARADAATSITVLQQRLRRIANYLDNADAQRKLARTAEQTKPSLLARRNIRDPSTVPH